MQRYRETVAVPTGADSERGIGIKHSNGTMAFVQPEELTERLDDDPKPLRWHAIVLRSIHKNHTFSQIVEELKKHGLHYSGTYLESLLREMRSKGWVGPRAEPELTPAGMAALMSAYPEGEGLANLPVGMAQNWEVEGEEEPEPWPELHDKYEDEDEGVTGEEQQVREQLLARELISMMGKDSRLAKYLTFGHRGEYVRRLLQKHIPQVREEAAEHVRGIDYGDAPPKNAPSPRRNLPPGMRGESLGMSDEDDEEEFQFWKNYRSTIKDRPPYWADPEFHQRIKTRAAQEPIQEIKGEGPERKGFGMADMSMEDMYQAWKNSDAHQHPLMQDRPAKWETKTGVQGFYPWVRARAAQEPIQDIEGEGPPPKSFGLADEELWGSFDPEQAARDEGLYTEAPKQKSGGSLPPGMTEAPKPVARVKQFPATTVHEFLKKLRPGNNIISVAYAQDYMPENKALEHKGLLAKHRLTKQATAEIYPKGIRAETVGRFNIGITDPPAAAFVKDPEIKGLIHNLKGTEQYLFTTAKEHKRTGLPLKESQKFFDNATGEQLTPQQVAELREHLLAKSKPAEPGKRLYRNIKLKKHPFPQGQERDGVASGSAALGFRYEQ